MHFRSCLAVALLVAALPGGLLAQAPDPRGNIVGRVLDPTGAVIPGADVRAINVATGVAAATKTNQAGNFSLPYLLPGTYTLTVEITGFKKFVREGVQVRVNETVELNPELQVGNVAE